MGTAAQQDLRELRGDRRSVKMFAPAGSIPDCKTLFDLSMTAGSPIASSSAAVFVAGDVGKAFYALGAGVAGADLVSTVSSFTDSNHVVLADNAATSVSGSQFRYGTDWTDAIDAGLNWLAVSAMRGGILFFPRGDYLTRGGHTLHHMITVQGEGYSSVSVFGGVNRDPASKITCILPVPIFAMATNPCYSPAFDGLGLMGVASSGSMGIHALNAWDLTVKHCFFDCFGDHAILAESAAPNYSVTATIHHNFAQNCMLVRTGRTAYVGVVDLACTDANVHFNNFSGSFADVSGIVTGFICAFAYRAANGFIGVNQFGHSEVGVYTSPQCNYTEFMGTRSDLNQGPGWIIDSVQCQYRIRSHANSLAADGVYNAVSLNGSGNTVWLTHTFNGFDITHLDPEFFRVKNGIENFNDLTTEPNYFGFTYMSPGSFVGTDILETGTQTNGPAVDFVVFNPAGRKSLRVRGDLKIQDYSFVIDESTGPANQKLWEVRPNYGLGFSELLYTILSDDYLTEIPYMKVSRIVTGSPPVMSVDFIQLLNADVIVGPTGNFKVQTSGDIIFTDGVGTPKAIKRDYGGTGHNAYAHGDLLVGNSSSGLDILNSGAGVLLGNPGGPTAFGQVDLSSGVFVTNTLPLGNGGTGGVDQSTAQISLGVYSKATVDAMFAAVYAALAGKATAGALTGAGGSPAHQHAQS